MKNTICENVGFMEGQRRIDDTYDFDGLTREEAIKMVNDAFDEVPDDATNAAFDMEYDYDNQGHNRLVVRYARPMTAEEIARRDAKMQTSKDAREAEERVEFARLQAKFGKV